MAFLCQIIKCYLNVFILLLFIFIFFTQRHHALNNTASPSSGKPQIASGSYFSWWLLVLFFLGDFSTWMASDYLITSVSCEFFFFCTFLFWCICFIGVIDYKCFESPFSQKSNTRFSPPEKSCGCRWDESHPSESCPPSGQEHLLHRVVFVCLAQWWRIWGKKTWENKCACTSYLSPVYIK